MSTGEEAIALFRKYRDVLNGEFLTMGDAQHANTAAKLFCDKLGELGFMVVAHVTSAVSYEVVRNGETIAVATIYYTLSLVPKPDSGIFTPTSAEIIATRIAAAAAIAKVYGSLPTVPPPREGEWNFTEMERHAFLTALERHNDKLIAACAQNNILHVSVTDWRLIFAGVGAMTSAPNDAFVLNFLIEAEVAYLNTRGTTEELELCGCQTGGHARTLKAWKRRNIR